MAAYKPIPESDQYEDFDVPDDDRFDDANATGAVGPLSSTPAPESQAAQKEKKRSS